MVLVEVTPTVTLTNAISLPVRLTETKLKLQTTAMSIMAHTPTVTTMTFQTPATSLMILLVTATTMVYLTPVKSLTVQLTATPMVFLTNANSSGTIAMETPFQTTAKS